MNEVIKDHGGKFNAYFNIAIQQNDQKIILEVSMIITLDHCIPVS